MTIKDKLQILTAIIALILCCSCCTSRKYHYYPKYNFNYISGTVEIVGRTDTVGNNLAHIAGIVFDKDTKEEIPFVNVYLIGPKVTHKVATDIDGIFEINKIHSEKYILELNFIGYYRFRDTLTLDEGNAYKVIIEMEENPHAFLE